MTTHDVDAWDEAAALARALTRIMHHSQATRDIRAIASHATERYYNADPHTERFQPIKEEFSDGQR